MASQKDIRHKHHFGLGFHIIHLIYQLFWPVVSLFALIRFWHKGVKEPGYRQHIGERLGQYSISNRAISSQQPIWIHALSLGETRGVAPLINHLLNLGHHIILTHTTPAGRQAGTQLFDKAITANQLTQLYIPLDFTPFVRRFLRTFKPKIGILMETDLWPGMIVESNMFNVPLFVVNARYPDNKVIRDHKSFNIKPRLFQGLERIFAKTNHDAHNFKRQGFNDVIVAGELKFDIALDPTQAHAAKQLKPAPPQLTFVAASTRKGEETIILNAFKKMQSQFEGTARLVIVPRSPQRFDDVHALLQAKGEQTLKRSTLPIQLDAAKPTQWPVGTILIGDSVGELGFYLGLADVVFVGGSLFDIGGHSIVEPLSLHKPILMGPSQWGTGEAAQLAQQFGALQTVQDGAALSDALLQLFQNPNTRTTMANNAQRLMTEMGGATNFIIHALESYLPHLK